MKPAFYTVHDNDRFQNPRSKMVLDAINAELRLIVEVLATPLTEAELDDSSRNAFTLSDGPVTRWHLQPSCSPEVPEVPEWARYSSCCYVIGENISTEIEARRIAHDVVLHASMLLRNSAVLMTSHLTRWYDLDATIRPGISAR